MKIFSKRKKVKHVGGWYIARRQYSSLCEGAAVVSLDAVDIGEEVLVRMQVECGREELNDRERQTRRDGQRTLKHTSWMA